MRKQASFEGLPATVVTCPSWEEAQAPSRDPTVRRRGEGRGRTEAPVPRSLISPSFTCLEPPHLANLTLENASECLTQH